MTTFWKLSLSQFVMHLTSTTQLLQIFSILTSEPCIAKWKQNKTKHKISAVSFSAPLISWYCWTYPVCTQLGLWVPSNDKVGSGLAACSMQVCDVFMQVSLKTGDFCLLVTTYLCRMNCRISNSLDLSRWQLLCWGEKILIVFLALLTVTGTFQARLCVGECMITCTIHHRRLP